MDINHMEDRCRNLKAGLDKIDCDLADGFEKRVRMIADFFKTCSQGLGDIPFYPSLEADVLRRMLTRNQGLLPPLVLAKIWRELITASAQVCRPYAIAVYTKKMSEGLMDLAGDYFGTSPRFIPCPSSARQVLKALTDNEAGAGVLPDFVVSEEEWWMALNIGPKPLHIVAKLPFVKRVSQGEAKTTAYIVSSVPVMPTGMDMSLFLIEMRTQISIGALKQSFDAASLPGTRVIITSHAAGLCTAVVEIETYITEADQRIVSIVKQYEKEIVSVRRIGGYVREIILEHLD